MKHFRSWRCLRDRQLHRGLKGETDLHMARDCPGQSRDPTSRAGVSAIAFLGFVEEPTVIHWEKQDIEGKQSNIPSWSTGSNFLGDAVKRCFCSLHFSAWCSLPHSLSNPSSENQWKFYSLGMPFLTYQSRPVLKIIQVTYALCMFLYDFTYCIVFLILKCMFESALQE